MARGDLQAPVRHARAVAALRSLGEQERADREMAAMIAEYGDTRPWRDAHRNHPEVTAVLKRAVAIVDASAPPRPGVNGTFDAAARLRQEPLRRCEPHAYRLPAGTPIGIVLSITAAGGVTLRPAAGSRSPAALSTCMTRVVRRWQLPPPGVPLEIEIPLRWAGPG